MISLLSIMFNETDENFKNMTSYIIMHMAPWAFDKHPTLIVNKLDKNNETELKSCSYCCKKLLLCP